MKKVWLDVGHRILPAGLADDVREHLLARDFGACFRPGMLADYIAKAVEKADYERTEAGRFFATIPGFKGLWAEGKTVEAARRELISTLEDWLLLAIRCGDEVPVVGGIDLNKIGRYAKARQSA